VRGTPVHPTRSGRAHPQPWNPSILATAHATRNPPGETNSATYRTHPSPRQPCTPSTPHTIKGRRTPLSPLRIVPTPRTCYTSHTPHHPGGAPGGPLRSLLPHRRVPR